MAKLLFFSDAHGCAGALEELGKRIREEAPDLIVFLGDALYHGPRNVLQGDYDPRRAADFFNGWAEKMIAVRGNCDAEVDQMLLSFPCMESYAQLWADGTRYFLTHGHKWSPEEAEALPPLEKGTVFVSGHTHIPRLDEATSSGLRFLNPGSISIPKGGSLPGYAVAEGTTLSLRNLYR